MISLSTPDRVRARAEVLPICRTRVSGVHVAFEKPTHQEHDRDVQQESAGSIRQKRPVTDACNFAQLQLWYFDDERSDTVHQGTCRSKVVERNERVHLELGRREQTFNHGESDGFEEDSEKLDEESDENELNLTERGNDDT